MFTLEAFDGGLRSFLIENENPSPVVVALFDETTGDTTSGSAPVGLSLWSIAAHGGDRVVSRVGDFPGLAAIASNALCGVVDGSAECAPTRRRRP